MLKFLPLLLVAAFVWWRLSAPARMARMLKDRSRSIDDPELLDGVARFAGAMDWPGFDVRVLKDMPDVNGVALPNGEIYISAGLYDGVRFGRYGRDEALAVIAHEIGHVALGHSRARQTAWTLETAALAGLGAVLGRLIFGWIGLLAGLALTLLRARISRRDEFEADGFGAQLLMRVGMDPEASVRLLSRLERKSAEATQGAPRWLLSHPPIPERIAYIRDVIAAGDPADRRATA